MKLTDLSIQVRQRSTWEAIDLGFALVQQHWLALILPLSLLVLMLALPFWLLVPDNYLWLAGLFIWWLKPLYDRLLLHILSRQLFNEKVTTAEAFSALPDLIRHTGLFSALSYRRFSLSRSYNLAIWQLEKLKGNERKERQALIYLQGHSNAIWLTIACIHLEWVILFSIYALILMFDASGTAWEHVKNLFRGDVDMDTQYWQTLFDFIFYSLTVLIIEPFYVAAGFMLYINRRTQLEAWDIEIAFRALGDRLAHLSKSMATLLPSLLIVFFSSLLLTIPSSTWAAEKSEVLNEQRLAADQAAAKIKEVMELPELSNRRQISTWVPKDLAKKDADKNALSSATVQLIAQIFKAILWIAVIVGVILLFIYREKLLAFLTPGRQRKLASPIPDVLFGLDIRPESLPEDIAGTARNLWLNGKTREALSLLYRGTLMVLTRKQHLAIQASHTEGDILQLAKPSLATERFNYLATLTKLWQMIAYAHRKPEDTELEFLFNQWPHFQQIHELSSIEANSSEVKV